MPTSLALHSPLAWASGVCWTAAAPVIILHIGKELGMGVP